MDKKNTTIGVALLLAAFAVMLWQNKNQPTPPPAPASAASATVESNSGAPASAPAAGPAAATAPVAGPTPGTVGANPLLAPLVADAADQTIVTLQNELLTLRLTDFGGAILDAEFRHHAAHKGETGRYDFNGKRIAPMLAFVGHPGLDTATRWTVVSQTATTAVFKAVAGSLEVTRTYELPAVDEKGEGYRVKVGTTLRNLGAEPIGAQRAAWHLGTATALHAHDTGMYLTTGYYDGDGTHYFDRPKLAGGSGFFGLGASVAVPHLDVTAPVRWAYVKNQYFGSILTLEKPGVGLVTRRVQVLPGQPETNPEAVGIAGDALLDLPRLEAGATAQVDAKFYVGPAEFKRLSQFAHKEDKAMQFDLFFFNRIFFASLFAPLLLHLMNFVHTYLVPDTVTAWGWAIVVATLILRTVFLPLNLAAAKSAKRMSKIQPLLKEINEKYADNPQKKQKETMALFQKAKVNPLGGCLPILITMPFFVAFYAILQTASELRFAEWFWIKDLTSPDTVARIPLFGWSIPLNIMPLLMGVTQVIQMRLVPTPTVDNAQAKMMQFMPYVMVAICYNFGSGLALYWTVSNLYTIGQQLIVNRMPDVDPLAEAAAAPGGKAKEKNVTPAGFGTKKKLK